MRGKATLLVTGILVAFFLAPAGWAVAEGDRPEPPGERDLARVREKIETLRAWRISEELNLDKETRDRLFTAMREADEEGWRIEALNRQLMRELRLEVEKEDGDPGAIASILDSLQANRMEKARAEGRHLTRVRGILSPEETARYLIFQLTFQRELRERAARAFREHGDDGESRGPDNSRHGSGREGGSSSGGGRGK